MNTLLLKPLFLGLFTASFFAVALLPAVSAPHLVREEAKLDDQKKTSGGVERTSGYHTGAGSPSRSGGDDFHLLLPESGAAESPASCHDREGAFLVKTLKALRRGDLLSTYRLLEELADSMPVDSTSRYFYRSLCSLAKQQLDRDTWYRYERRSENMERISGGVRSPDREKNLPLKLALEGVSKTNLESIAEPAARNVASLRLETWMLLKGTEPGQR